MALKHTKKHLKNGAPAQSTAPHLPGSKSSYNRGLFSEHLVHKYFKQQKYKLIKHRYKCPFTEIDLIFLSPKGRLLLVEVKTLNSMKNWPFFLISPNQIKRLRRGYVYFQSRSKVPVDFYLALVLRSDEIKIVEDFLTFYKES